MCPRSSYRLKIFLIISEKLYKLKEDGIVWEYRISGQKKMTTFCRNGHFLCPASKTSVVFAAGFNSDSDLSDLQSRWRIC